MTKTAIVGTTSGGAQTEILTYESVQLGGGGSLVGPGASPSVAPTLALAAGTGLASGTYEYGYTDVTAAGESLLSPLGTITTGLLAPTTTNGPTPTVGVGAGVDVGSQEYVYTLVNGAGETTPGPSSVPVTTRDVPPPTSGGTTANDSFGFGLNTNYYSPGDSVYSVTVFINAAGESTAGPASNTVVAVLNTTWGTAQDIDLTGVSVSSDPTVTSKRTYWNVNGAWKFHQDIGAAVTSSRAGGTLSGSAPSGTNLANVRQVSLTGIPIGGATTTGRRIYRRFNGAGSFLLVATLNDNTTTTYLDTTPNASLGAAAPSSNTAWANQVALSAIAIGPAGTVSRNLYRTLVNGSQLKFLATVTDNVLTSVGVDVHTDATIAGNANAPTGDTSGITQPTGQVNAGSTLVPVSSLAPFYSSGGWVSLSGGQIVRYTGFNSNLAAPSSAMTAVATAGAGLTAGVYLYTYTFVYVDGSESLQSPPVSVTTSGGNLAVALTNCNVGGAGVVSRNLYRTIANGVQVKFLANVADNTTTSIGTDFHTDASIAGNTNAPVPSLSGIPTSGPGSIATTVVYGTPAGAVPALTGVNQWNGVPLAMAKGSTVAIWVQRDDTAAQAALGALELDDDGNPTDGIREYMITDSRMGSDLLAATCDADLAQFSRPIVTCTYCTRDVKTKAGRTVSINLPGGGYANQVLRDGAIGYWRLGDAVGSSVATDSSAYAHDGTPNFTASDPITFGLPGPIGDGTTAALFSQISSGCWIDIGDIPALNLTGNFTLEGWGATTSVGVPTLIGKFDGTHGYFLVLNAGNLRAGCYKADGSAVFDVSSPLTYNDNALHHFGVTYDGAHVVLYADGGPVRTTAATGTPNATTGNVNIGRTSNALNFWPGTLAELAIFPSALTAAQMAAHYGLRTSGLPIGAWGLSGDFTIQSVDITFDVPNYPPLRKVTASSVAFTMADLLRTVVLK